MPAILITHANISAPLTRRSSGWVGGGVDTSALKVTRRLRAVFSKAAAAEIGKLLQRADRSGAELKYVMTAGGAQQSHGRLEQKVMCAELWLSMISVFLLNVCEQLSQTYNVSLELNIKIQ